MSEAFRTEIIENQKARVDLVKWKLIIVAAVFAWSLNKDASNSQQLSFLAISLVPFVCLFVDSQCFHINLRTLVIGQFLRLYKPEPRDQSQYEMFVHELRTGHGLTNIFELEQGVLTISTCFLCIGVISWPIVVSFCLDVPPLTAMTVQVGIQKNAAVVEQSLPSAAPLSLSNRSTSSTPSAPKEYGKYACWIFGFSGLIFSGLLTYRYKELQRKLLQHSNDLLKKD
jgi:hypothetical protein